MGDLVFAVSDVEDLGLDREPDYSRLGVEYNCSTGLYKDVQTGEMISRKEVLRRESEFSYDC